MENKQRGEGPGFVGLGLGVITLLCFVVRGLLAWELPGCGCGGMGLVKLSRLGSVLLADRAALISHYRVRAVFRP